MKNLLSGMIVGAIVIGTIFGAVLLSMHDSRAIALASPSPTILVPTLTPTPAATPTPSFTPTAAVVTPRPIAVTLSPTPTPSATPTSSPTPTLCPIPIGWQRYTVGPFDTLSIIAQKFNTAVDQLMQANCLSTPTVTWGQTIYVPSTAPTLTPRPTETTCLPPPFSWVIYIVRPGDTLSTLAARYNTSVVRLIQVNCLPTTTIYIGQRLLVPPTFVVTFPPPPTWTPRPFNTPTPTFAPPIDTPTPTMIPPTTPAPIFTDTPSPTDTPPVPTATPPISPLVTPGAA